MPETGFFAQKRGSPTSLGLVILFHAALIAAVVLIKSPVFRHIADPTVVTLIEDDTVPPPDRHPPPPREQPQHPREQIDQVPTIIPTIPTGPTIATVPDRVEVASNTAGTGIVDIPRLPPDPPPVRRAAQIDPSSQLQPPYPAPEIRLQRDGRVQVRVTIGPDGRVKDVVLLSATSDAFWRVTREQALRHWRFRPATLDGRPVEETKVMSLIFRIVDQG